MERTDKRIVSDEMGDVAIPANALYGAQTYRAVLNFPISDRRFGREFIRALGLTKKAAAIANARTGALDPAICAAITKAADEVIDGRHDSQFVVDVFQTGSGTSTNMNTNELIAQLATNASGLTVHPQDHVNRSQSSNDVVPTALHVSTAMALQQQLLPAMHRLKEVLFDKSKKFGDIVKIGRTHLQDAVPIRLGDEFSAYARQVELAVERLYMSREGLFELAIGGTAVGNGLNAPRGFGSIVAGLLANWAGLPFREAVNHFEAQASRDATSFVSAALRNYALALIKICNDLRLLASGPRCGIGEIMLPAVQPGSSMMPGKVNPVIIESLLMVCAQVIGHDASIAYCCSAGQLELNATIPLMAANVVDQIKLLSSATTNFAEHCVAGIEPDRERIAELVERSLSVATALTPHIGHEKAAAIVREAAASRKTIREVAAGVNGLSTDVLRELLDPLRMTRQ
jgi:fumarate hydratase class II